MAVKSLKCGSIAFASMVMMTIPAMATDFCVELTVSEFPHSAQRRGDDNSCSNPDAANIAGENAINAIEPQCVNNVTLQSAAHACTRANLNLNTSPINWWAAFPPSAKPNAFKVRYVGHGIGSASSVNLCGVAHVVSFTRRFAVDGTCSWNGGSPPLRTFVTVHARARCAVVCSTP